MKTTSRLLLAVAAIALLSLAFSCTTKTKEFKGDDDGGRIKLKEYRSWGGTWYTIIEVDSVEYLFQDKGGAVKLSK